MLGLKYHNVINTMRRITLSFTVLLACVLAWEGAWRLRFWTSPLLPPPRQVLSGLIDEASHGELYADIAASLKRVAVGFLWGTGLGLLVGGLLLQRRIRP